MNLPSRVTALSDGGQKRGVVAAEGEDPMGQDKNESGGVYLLWRCPTEPGRCIEEEADGCCRTVEAVGRRGPYSSYLSERDMPAVCWPTWRIGGQEACRDGVLALFGLWLKVRAHWWAVSEIDGLTNPL